MYWSEGDQNQILARELEEANSQLSHAAIEAVNSHNRSIWEDVAAEYADLGACDSEPNVQFETIWNMVYEG